MKSFSKACADILHCRTTFEYIRQLTEFANDRDFGIFSALVVIDHSPTLREFSGVTTAPTAYLDIYHNVESAEKDPVSQHCKVSSVPICWDADTYYQHNCSHLWEEQSPYGFKAGIAMAIHLPHGKHFFIGLDRDGPLRRQSKAFEELVCDFKTLATYAQAAAFELMLSGDSDATDPNISHRELDALRFTMDGDAPAAIAKRIGVSERTVELRLKSAVRKLGCTSKFEAVLRAIRLGYVTC